MKQVPIRRKILSLTLYILAALCIAYVMSHRYPPNLAVGALAPLDDKIVLINGSDTSFRNYKKPLLVNFMATWCSPCQQEMPILARLAVKYAPVSFISIAVDSPRADIMAIKNNLKIEYPLAQSSAQTIKNWHAELLPTTYLVDSTGKIAWAHAGLIKEEELESALQNLIKK